MHAWWFHRIQSGSAFDRWRTFSFLCFRGTARGRRGALAIIRPASLSLGSSRDGSVRFGVPRSQTSHSAQVATPLEVDASAFQRTGIDHLGSVSFFNVSRVP